MAVLDINCDMGESFGRFQMGNDEAVFPFITSCNIACGFHGGDPVHILRTIELALKHAVRIGAHPSYPDLAGFGRRDMQLTAEELNATIRYQLAMMKGLVESCGGQLSYVKPHGALYNEMARNPTASKQVIEAVRQIDDELALMGLANSRTQEVAAQEGMTFIPEAFIDRQYEADGRLMSRSKEGAVIENAAQALKQLSSIYEEGYTLGPNGERVLIRAESFCIHGDNPAALPILQELHDQLPQHYFSHAPDPT